jgi:hypothetical protein
VRPLLGAKTARTGDEDISPYSARHINWWDSSMAAMDSVCSILNDTGSHFSRNGINQPQSSGCLVLSFYVVSSRPTWQLVIPNLDASVGNRNAHGVL